MHRLATEFKHLSLTQQHEVFPEIFAAYNAAKEARRQELEAEIKSLGFKPGEAKKPPTVAAKYRSKKDPAKTWAGRGAEPTWLKKEMAETGLPLDAFATSSAA